MQGHSVKTWKYYGSVHNDSLCSLEPENVGPLRHYALPACARYRKVTHQGWYVNVYRNV